MNYNKIFIFFFIYFQLIIFNLQLYSASLNLDVDYQLRGLSYPNLDFNTKTSTDAVAYNTQRLRIALIGKFIPEIEICMKLQSIGVVGSEIPHQQFSWQKEYPYKNTSFIPFIENAYAKLTKFAGYPVEITLGRQSIEYPAPIVFSDGTRRVESGGGIILSDNGAGMNALKVGVNYPYKLYTEVFTAKLKENFYPSKDFDIQGIAVKYPVKEYQIEFGYFGQNDFTGTIYTQGKSTSTTNSIRKQFYSFRISKSGKWGYYYANYIWQQGNLDVPGANIKSDARAFLLEGRLFGEQKRFGKVSGYGLIAGVTGNKNVGISGPGGWFSTDETFTPELTKRFDGLKRAGWGEYAGFSVFDHLWDVPKINLGGGVEVDAYSGFGTIGFGLDISPWYGWTFGASGFFFSAAEAYKTIPQRAATVTSGSNSPDVLLNILLGLGIRERYNLGAELDLFAKYTLSKYIDFKFGYSRYTPPTVPDVWPNRETSDFYIFEMNTKF